MHTALKVQVGPAPCLGSTLALALDMEVAGVRLPGLAGEDAPHLPLGDVAGDVAVIIGEQIAVADVGRCVSGVSFRHEFNQTVREICHRFTPSFAFSQAFFSQ